MSADRFKISDYGTKLLVVDSKDGDSVAILRDKMNSRGTMIIAGAIRQQARDLDQIRTDLAAAVARAEQAEARLAAIESESATMTVGAKWPKGL